MNRTRLAALLVLGAIAVAAACTSKANNGEECLKNADCVSDRCIQYVCVDPSASRTATDSGTAAETAADVAPETTTPTDTGSGADTADAGSDTGTSDTSAD